jgi:manganese oxidase
MHLHGFFYRVDQLAGPLATMQSRPVPGQLVVTQLLEPLSSMSMTWSPDRPGNWLFHCHFALHNMPSGAGNHLTPAIAPGDSFVARFTPPRSGTYMYHAHTDEYREELAGLEGALIVRDSVVHPAPEDHVLFFKGYSGDLAHPLEIDGQANPDTLVLHAGQTARLRLINLSTSTNTAAPEFWLTARPDSLAALARDTMLVRWLPVAKDAFDLPASARSARAAQQIVSVGESYDVEYTPQRRGTLRLEVRAAAGQHPLFIRVPIRVE